MRNPSLISSSSSSSSQVSGKITPCCSREGLKRGPWTTEEDEILCDFIRREGEGRWRTLPKRAGLLRCGKSCRLRWMNYLRPSLKRGQIAPDEEDLILRLHRLLGNRWALIAGRIPGRTDNDIKNYWNTHLSKKLVSQGIDPRTHKPLNPENPKSSSSFQSLTPENPINNSSMIIFQPKAPSMIEMNNQDSVKKNNDHLEDTLDLHQHYTWQNYNPLLPLQRVNEVQTGEDVFSSMLNTWIHDEMFGYNNPVYESSISYSELGYDDECKRFDDHFNKGF